MTKPVKGDQLMALVARRYATYYAVDWDFVGEDLDDIEKSLRRVTDREREVLDLVVEGHSSRAIAAQCGVSTKTIEAHRSRINDKIRHYDIAYLVRMMMASEGE